jgi:hypothetical protein
LLLTQYYQSGANDATKNDFLKRWTFRYVYDLKKRLIQKQVPGAEPVYMVYDKRDRLVMTQDGNQRSSAKKYWTFTKYDELNRPILTGIKEITRNATQAQMQVSVDSFYNIAGAKVYEQYVGNVANNIHGYTNQAYPTTTAGAAVNKDHYLTVTYYDRYDFKSQWVGSYSYVYDSLSQNVNGVLYPQPLSENQQVIGQVTGSKVKVLDGGVTGGYTWLKTVNYFDERYRIVQVISDNYKGGEDRTSTLYDFSGKVRKSRLTHIERDVTWKDMVGVAQTGNKLVKTAASSAWNNSGTASGQQLAAGQDGWLEVTVSETNTARMVALILLFTFLIALFRSLNKVQITEH